MSRPARDSRGIAARRNRRYVLEYAAALIGYVATLWICLPLARNAADAGQRLLFMLGPCAGVLLLAAAVIRHVLRIDEYMRKAVTEYFAIDATATGVFALAYTRFEQAGFRACP